MLPACDCSDNERMLRVQAGDLAAFELLIERFQTMLHGLAISMLLRPEDAEEATQDAFLKLRSRNGQTYPVVVPSTGFAVLGQ